MKLSYFLYISILLLMGCDQAQQDRMADRANKLIDPEAFCVVQYEKFYQGPYLKQILTTNNIPPGDVSKIVVALQSTLAIHDSANLTDCPVELISAVNSTRQGLQNMISLLTQRRDYPFGFIKKSTIHATSQQWEDSYLRINSFLKAYNSDSLIDLEK